MVDPTTAAAPTTTAQSFQDWAYSYFVKYPVGFSLLALPRQARPEGWRRCFFSKDLFDKRIESVAEAKVTTLQKEHDSKVTTLLKEFDTKITALLKENEAKTFALLKETDTNRKALEKDIELMKMCLDASSDMNAAYCRTEFDTVVGVYQDLMVAISLARFQKHTVLLFIKTSLPHSCNESSLN